MGRREAGAKVIGEGGGQGEGGQIGEGEFFLDFNWKRDFNWLVIFVHKFTKVHSSFTLSLIHTCSFTSSFTIFFSEFLTLIKVLKVSLS